MPLWFVRAVAVRPCHNSYFRYRMQHRLYPANRVICNVPHMDARKHAKLAAKRASRFSLPAKSAVAMTQCERSAESARRYNRTFTAGMLKVEARPTKPVEGRVAGLAAKC